MAAIRPDNSFDFFFSNSRIITIAKKEIAIKQIAKMNNDCILKKDLQLDNVYTA